MNTVEPLVSEPQGYKNPPQLKQKSYSYIEAFRHNVLMYVSQTL